MSIWCRVARSVAKIVWEEEMGTGLNPSHINLQAKQTAFLVIGVCCCSSAFLSMSWFEPRSRKSRQIANSLPAASTWSVALQVFVNRAAGPSTAWLATLLCELHQCQKLNKCLHACMHACFISRLGRVIIIYN